MASNPPPTIVLVHGAAHSDPSYFNPLIQNLKTQGLDRIIRTACPSNTCDPPTKGIHANAEYLRQVLEKPISAGEDVFVFMHSMGGMVGTEAITEELTKEYRAKKGLKGGIVHLYYCCAFILQEGQSTFILGQEVGPEIFPSSATVDDHGKATFPNAAYSLYNDLPPEEQQHWISKLGYFTLADLIEPLRNTAWKYLPCTYLFCTEDQAVTYRLQQHMVKGVRDAGVHIKTETLKSAHSPFLNMPEKVAESVARAAGAV